jgi:hypothetical protein
MGIKMLSCKDSPLSKREQLAFADKEFAYYKVLDSHKHFVAFAVSVI